MNLRTRAGTLAIACFAVFSSAALYSAASPAADDAALLKDLTAVVALLGQPCGAVIAATRLADNDHIATCKNGNRFRVFINADGRVVAQKE